MVTLDLNGGGFDASDFPVGLFKNLSLEAFALAVTQILPQEHGCPVLRLGTTGAGLDINKAAVLVERVGKHAAEFHRLDLLLQCMGIGFDREQRVFVVFFACHVQQVAGITQSAADVRQRVDNIFERFFFFAQVLGALGVVPDCGIFQLGVDLFEFL